MIRFLQGQLAKALQPAQPANRNRRRIKQPPTDRYVAESGAGRQEAKEHVLDEGDETWVVRLID
jgi:hypothetical protein